MDQTFNPYRKWLGIPASDQPAHHYRLLGIDLFETDADVISNAADGRMAQVKNYAVGKHAADSQRILNEVAAAKICLLNPQKKAIYDLQLQQRLVPATEAAPEAIPAETDVGTFDFAAITDSSKRSTLPKASKAKKQPWPIYAAVGGGVITASALALFFTLHTSSPAENARVMSNQAASTDLSSRPEPKPMGKPEPKPQPTLLAKAEVKVDGLAAVAAPPFSSGAGAGGERAFTPKPSKVAATDVGGKSEPKPQSAVQPQRTLAKAPPLPKPKEVATADAASETKSAKSKLADIPEKSLQQEAEAKIREIFQQEFSGAKTGKAHAALAKKLIQQADGSKDDAAARYVLLRMAGEQAVLGGDVVQAMEVIDKIQENYQIDAVSMKADVLAAIMRRSAEKTTITAVVDAAMKLSEEAMVRDDFELASRFANAASTAGRKSRDPDQNRSIIARIKEIERMKGRFAAVQKALETLESDAADGGANLIAGQWYCFTKGDWDKGLPMLAKGSRDDLAELAKQDLAKPTAPKDRMALGDGWWTLGEKEPPAIKQGFEARAQHWYEESLPQLTGLDKTRVEKRLEQHSMLEPVMNARQGVIQKGNVALAANGTSVVANKPWLNPAAALFDGNSTRYSGGSGIASTPWPCEWIVTLDKVYRLQAIRIKLFDLDNRYYRYRLWTSSDGKKFIPVVDRSLGEWRGWQDIKFSSRAVKFVKLEGIYGSANGYFHVVEFEAYCIPPALVPGK